MSSGDSNAGTSGGNDSTPATPSKTWAVDYAQVWVQDSAAWDESIFTYDTQEKSICNVCDTDITGHYKTVESDGHWE